jgi:hypothetical protein
LLRTLIAAKRALRPGTFSSLEDHLSSLSLSYSAFFSRVVDFAASVQFAPSDVSIASI